MATLAASIQPILDNQNVLADLAHGVFDLDVAVGVQLDQIGLWIGRSRQVRVPLSGVYFSLDTTALGFDQGNWQGPFDASTGLTSLDDSTYRALLRAKIIMNSWDGSAIEAAAAINMLFTVSPGTFTTIQDNQDMSMIVGVSGTVPSAALISLLQNGEFDVQPVGVGITYSITSVNTVALFGLDIESSAIAGFDVGAWSGQGGVVPGQVTGFVLVSSTANAATFSWVAPLTGVGPYTYQFQWKVTGSAAFVFAPVVNTTTTSISGLASGQSYVAQVYAVASGGAGPPSAQITFSTSAGPPGQVTALAETASTTTSISISWNLVAGATAYQVLYRVSGTTTFITGPNTASTSLTLTGLLAATVYDITVYATNTSGSGNQAAILTVGTVGAGPGAVQGLSLISITASDIAISWSNPTTGNGPFAFAVQYAVNTVPVVYQQFAGTIGLTASGGSCDITGLASSVTYLIRVAASNLGGNGPYSTPLSVQTLTGVPNQVTGLTSSSLTSTSVALTWSAVTNAVTYQIQYQLAGTTAWTNGPVVTAPTVTGTVTGLLAGYTYNFRVYAIGP